MNEKHGRVIAVHDMVIDVQFAPEETPLILSGLKVGVSGDGRGPALQVVQRVRDGLVRCVARGDLAGITPGAPVVDAGEPLLAPLGAELLARVVPILGALRQRNGQAEIPGKSEMLETGIKVIDLLCPFARGGTVGIFGPNGNGRMVIGAEVMHNIAHEQRGITIFAFLNGELEGRALYDASVEAPRPTGTNQIVFLPIDNSIDIASPAALAVSPLLDARIYLSVTLAKLGIWPAIDPLLSTSRLMDPAILGREHHDVARAVRDLLRRQRELLEGAPEGKLRAFTADERRLIARARKVQRFVSQPFAVAEEFTGRAGQVVPLAETLRACKALLDGHYDDVQEEAFMWRGALDSMHDVAR